MDTPEGKTAYTVNEFLKAVGISRFKFYQLLNSGQLVARKIGGRTVVTVADADRWLKSLPEYSPHPKAA